MEGRTVPEIMKRLHEEHRNIARLLAVLERELAIFDRGEQPDYDVLTGVAEWFKDFPEEAHHPKENIILARLREKYPEAAKKIGDLEGEHERISTLAQTFHNAVTNVLRDAELPRGTFHAVITNFIAEQRKHMEMEESRFFPLAEDTLKPEDWKAIEAEAGSRKDPLFDGEVAQRYAKVAADLIEWERQNEKAAE